MNIIMIVVLATVLLVTVVVGIHLLSPKTDSKNKGPVVKISQGDLHQVVEIKDHSVYVYYEPTPEEIGSIGVMSECADPNIDMEDTSTMTEFLSCRDEEKLKNLILDLTRSGVLLFREDGTQITVVDAVNNIISSRDKSLFEDIKNNSVKKSTNLISNNQLENQEQTNNITSNEQNFVQPGEDKFYEDATNNEGSDREVTPYEEEQLVKKRNALNESVQRENKRKNRRDIEMIQNAMKNLASFSIPKDLTK